MEHNARVQLNAWLKEPGAGGKRRSIRALALRAQTTRRVIYKIIGGHVPRPATARRISQATNGAVTVAELLRLRASEVAA